MIPHATAAKVMIRMENIFNTPCYAEFDPARAGYRAIRAKIPVRMYPCKLGNVYAAFGPSRSVPDTVVRLYISLRCRKSSQVLVNESQRRIVPTFDTTSAFVDRLNSLIVIFAPSALLRL